MFIFLSLLAGLANTLVNFADKAVVSKYVTDYKVASIFGAVAGGVLALLVLPFSKIALSTADLLLIISSGAILFFSYFFYWQAISKTSASNIVVFLQISPVFILILSFIFIDERLIARQLAGFCLILLTTILFSIKKEKNEPRFVFNRALLPIIISSLFFAISAVVAKHIVSEVNFLTTVALEGIGVAIGGMFLVIFSKNIRNDFSSIVKKYYGKPLAILFLIELLYLVYRAISYFAFSFGPVSIERAIEGSRVFMAFLLGAFLYKYFSSIFSAEEKSITFYRFILLAGLVLGIYLVG